MIHFKADILADPSLYTWLVVQIALLIVVCSELKSFKSFILSLLLSFYEFYLVSGGYDLDYTFLMFGMFSFLSKEYCKYDNTHQNVLDVINYVLLAGTILDFGVFHTIIYVARLIIF